MDNKKKSDYAYANYSREFLHLHGISRYRMKKIQDMGDDDVCQKCHWYCEENNLVNEWNHFIDKKLENRT